MYISSPTGPRIERFFFLVTYKAQSYPLESENTKFHVLRFFKKIITAIVHKKCSTGSVPGAVHGRVRHHSLSSDWCQISTWETNDTGYISRWSHRRGVIDSFRQCSSARNASKSEICPECIYLHRPDPELSDFFSGDV